MDCPVLMKLLTPVVGYVKNSCEQYQQQLDEQAMDYLNEI